MVEEPAVGGGDTLVERDGRRPSEAGQLGDVEELARRTVRLAGVPLDGPVVADDLRDGRGELADGTSVPVPTLTCSSPS